MTDNNSNHSKTKSLMYGTLIYAIGNLSTKILSFLIVPLYTYYILPADMGTYDLLNTTIFLLTPIVTLQISDGAYVRMVQNANDIDKYIISVYKFVGITSLITIVCIFSLNELVPIPYVVYFTSMLITGRWMQTAQRLLRGVKNQKTYAFSSIAYTTVFLLMNLLQIVIFRQGVEALFQSTIVANLVTIIIIFASEKKLRKFSFSLKSIELQKDMLKFSIPLIPNQLNWWVINSSDRYIVRFFLGNTANGIYAIAYKFPSMLQLVYNIFYQAWQDMALGDKEDDGGLFYSKVFRCYYKLSLSFLFVLIPLTKIFIQLALHNSYEEATQYISLLYLGTVFQAFSSFFGVGYLKENKTKQIASTSIMGAIINIVVNIMFIERIGLYAAALSTFIGFFVVFIVRTMQTKKIMKVTINWMEFAIYFFGALFVTFICMFTNLSKDLIVIFVGTIVFVIVNKEELCKIIVLGLERSGIKNRIRINK